MIEYSFQLPHLSCSKYFNLAIVLNWIRNDILTAWCDTQLADKLGIGWDDPGTTIFLLSVPFAEKAEKNVGIDAVLLMFQISFNKNNGCCCWFIVGKSMQRAVLGRQGAAYCEVFRGTSPHCSFYRAW
jgi:hypothetical protein